MSMFAMARWNRPNGQKASSLDCASFAVSARRLCLCLTPPRIHCVPWQVARLRWPRKPQKIRISAWLTHRSWFKTLISQHLNCMTPHQNRPQATCRPMRKPLKPLLWKMAEFRRCNPPRLAIPRAPFILPRQTGFRAGMPAPDAPFLVWPSLVKALGWNGTMMGTAGFSNLTCAPHARLGSPPPNVPLRV